MPTASSSVFEVQNPRGRSCGLKLIQFKMELETNDIPGGSGGLLRRLCHYTQAAVTREHSGTSIIEVEIRAVLVGLQ